MRRALAGLKRAGEPISASFDRLPIRTRLAGVSALLTFVILCAFAIAIGSLTVHRIRTDFNRQVSSAAAQLPSELHIVIDTEHNPSFYVQRLNTFANRADHVVIRIFSLSGSVLAEAPKNATSLGSPFNLSAHNIHGYRVVSEHVEISDNGIHGELLLQYGRSVSATEATVKRVELFLLLGVIGGSVFALIAGMAIARRAMKPIANLTGAAAEIARTRDPSQRLPQPVADDEVSELATTLDGMLRELDAARGETEAMLSRQRAFVADASHELRTPLTSVLANLELLADSLHGDQGDAAHSALRSSRRMRRLVADLLLLARSDAARTGPRAPCDLAQIVVEAAAELGPVAERHEVSLDAQPAPVMGARDELYRVVINLMENAINHTPAGTSIEVTTGRVGGRQGDRVRLEVADNGPGVPEDLAPTLFERFVRGAGDRGGSSGLGLAIVKAVAMSHGGDVKLEAARTGSGARFVVELPALSDLDQNGQDHRPALEPVVDQLR